MATPIILASQSLELNHLWQDALQNIARLERADDLASLLKKLEEHGNGTIVLDLTLPGLDAIQGIEHIRSAFPGVKIVAISDSENEREIAAMFHAGAKGFCHRNTQPSLLRKAVKKIGDGEIWLKRRLIGPVLSEIERLCPAAEHTEPKNSPLPSFANLTTREHEIATLVGKGLCQKTIARQLAISENTVRNHLRNIFRKIGVASSLQLALMVRGKIGTVE